MTPEVLDLWQRALRALKTAGLLVQEDPDASASRSYYAAFYGVAALLVLEGQAPAKHSGVEAAVHRDLVKPGRWPLDLGAAYTWLAGLRSTADYGGGLHVRPEESQEALDKATRLVQAVRTISPEPLPEPS
jgi:uncharacterized protein (UPF0332 family)